MLDMLTEQFSTDKNSIFIGRIVGMRDGQAFLSLGEGNEPPVPAHAAVSIDSEGDNLIDASVLVYYNEETYAFPIIVGVIRDRLIRNCEHPSRHSTLDGATVSVSGKEEVILRCGLSSIALRQDGKVLIKGKQIVSNAEGTNRIKGGSVAIN